jgi:outer membrane protein
MPLDKNWWLNFDVRKVYIRSDVFVGADNKGSLKLDPVFVGLGLGYRF